MANTVLEAQKGRMKGFLIIGDNGSLDTGQKKRGGKVGVKERLRNSSKVDQGDDSLPPKIAPKRPKPENGPFRKTLKKAARGITTTKELSLLNRVNLLSTPVRKNEE